MEERLLFGTPSWMVLVPVLLLPSQVPIQLLSRQANTCIYKAETCIRNMQDIGVTSSSSRQAYWLARDCWIVLWTSRTNGFVAWSKVTVDSNADRSNGCNPRQCKSQAMVQLETLQVLCNNPKLTTEKGKYLSTSKNFGLYKPLILCWAIVSDI